MAHTRDAHGRDGILNENIFDNNFTITAAAAAAANPTLYIAFFVCLFIISIRADAVAFYISSVSFISDEMGEDINPTVGYPFVVRSSYTSLTITNANYVCLQYTISTTTVYYKWISSRFLSFLTPPARVSQKEYHLLGWKKPASSLCCSFGVVISSCFVDQWVMFVLCIEDGRMSSSGVSWHVGVRERNTHMLLGTAQHGWDETKEEAYFPIISSSASHTTQLSVLNQCDGKSVWKKMKYNPRNAHRAAQHTHSGCIYTYLVFKLWSIIASASELIRLMRVFPPPPMGGLLKKYLWRRRYKSFLLFIFQPSLKWNDGNSFACLLYINDGSEFQIYFDIIHTANCYSNLCIRPIVLADG